MNNGGFVTLPEPKHGKYRPIAELGQGGTANVYLAVARGPSDFNKLVVLKFLKHELASEAEFHNMFMSEARLAARLNHPNVVQTNEVFEVDGQPVIVMEYLEGQPLSRIVARARDPEHGGQGLPLLVHLRILIDALSGLHYSHELTDYDGTPLCVVHRDVTPQNVFVSYDGRVCVLDFGIAKLTGAHETQTHTGVVKGKLRYMPYEQLMGSRVDRRADIFAIGVMLWEAATGKKMWEGVADPAVVHKVATGQITPPRKVNPDVPDELERIIMKALAHDREHRHATAAELQAELEAFADRRLPSSREVGKLVSDMFAEQRRKMRALIEQQLLTISQSPATDASDPALPFTSSSPLPQAYTTSVSDQAMSLPKRSPVKRALVVLALAVLLVATPMLMSRSSEPQRVSTDPVVPVAAASMQEPEPLKLVPEPAPAEAPEVTLRLRAEPVTAKLFLDDEPLPENPHVITVPKNNEPHTLRAEAKGYHALSRTLRFNEDANVELVLEPLADKRKARRRAGKRTSEAPVRAAQATTVEQPKARVEPPTRHKGDETDECSVPYFIDSSGIRRIKRECVAK